MSGIVHKVRSRCNPETPRFLQQGEGFGADPCAGYATGTLHARSLAQLKSAALRDDAFGRGPYVASECQSEATPT